MPPRRIPTGCLALRAAGSLLTKWRLTWDDVLQITRGATREHVEAAEIRARAAAVMASPAFALLHHWQRGFVHSLTEWTSRPSPRQREVLEGIEDRIAAAAAAGSALDGMAP